MNRGLNALLSVPDDDENGETPGTSGINDICDDLNSTENVIFTPDDSAIITTNVAEHSDTDNNISEVVALKQTVEILEAEKNHLSKISCLEQQILFASYDPEVNARTMTHQNI